MSTQVRELPVRRRSEPCCASANPPTLGLGETQRLAEVLKSVSDATRVGMLDLLVQQSEPLCVCDITPQFRQNQPTISHHLKILREAGLIGTEKRGLWAYYWATDDGRRVFRAIEELS